MARGHIDLDLHLMGLKLRHYLSINTQINDVLPWFIQNKYPIRKLASLFLNMFLFIHKSELFWQERDGIVSDNKLAENDPEQNNFTRYYIAACAID